MSDPWDVSSVIGNSPAAQTQDAQTMQTPQTPQAPTSNGDANKAQVVEGIDTLGFLQLKDVPTGITPGSHKGKLTAARVIQKQLKDAPDGVMQLKLSLTYQSEGGDSLTEFKNLGILAMPDGSKKPNTTLNKDGKPQHEVDRKWLKSRLLNLGVREEDVDTIRIQDLVGTPVVMTVSQQGQYMNISFVKIDDDAQVLGNVATGQPGSLTF